MNSVKIAHDALHQKTDVKTLEDAWSIQDKLDILCRHFVTLFGGDRVTNYIFIMKSAVLVPFLLEYGTFYWIQNQGFEGTMGVTRFHIVNKTTNGGWKNGFEDGNRTSYGDAMRKYMALSAIFKTQLITDQKQLFRTALVKGARNRNLHRACRQRFLRSNPLRVPKVRSKPSTRQVTAKRFSKQIAKKVVTKTGIGKIFYNIRENKIHVPSLEFYDDDSLE